MQLVKINVLFLLPFSSVYAHHGTTPEHDYFAAYQSTEIKEILYLVDVAHTNKVMDRIRDGSIGYAIAEVKYALGKFPNHPKALMLIGLVAKLNKTSSLPIPYYEKALKLYPQYSLTHAQYGAYLVSIGRIDVGITKLREAIEIDPKLATAHAWLAQAYSKNGNPELARQAAEQARTVGYSVEIPADIPGK